MTRRMESSDGCQGMVESDHLFTISSFVEYKNKDLDLLENLFKISGGRLSFQSFSVLGEYTERLFLQGGKRYFLYIWFFEGLAIIF